MSVHRNVAANYLGSVWTGLVGLAVVPLYLRYLGVESYGLIGFFVTLQAWLFLLDMGLAPTLNREMARFIAGKRHVQDIHDLLRSMSCVYAAVAVFVALAVWLAAAWVAGNWLQLRTLPVEAATRALATMGVAFAFQWIATLYRSAVLGLQHQVWLSGFTAGIATVRAAMSVAVVAWISPTIQAFAVVQVIAAAVEALTLAWRLRGLLPRPPLPARPRLASLRDIGRFAAGLTAITVLATALTQVDKLLLATLLPLDTFGYFTLAASLAGALTLMVMPLHNAAYPRLSELVALGDPSRLAREYHRFAQLLAVALLPAALVLAVFAGEIVLLWTRDPRTANEVAPLLALWTVGTTLNGLMHVPYAAQLAHGWTRLTIMVNTVAVALMVPATLWLVPRYGAVAAAWIWIAINAGYVLVQAALMHRRILQGQGARWYLQDVLAPLAAAALPVIALAWLHRQLPPFGAAGEAAYIVLAVSAAALGAAMATPAGSEVLRSIGAVVRAIRQRAVE